MKQARRGLGSVRAGVSVTLGLLFVVACSVESAPDANVDESRAALTTTTLIAMADTQVDDGHPNTNYGASPTLGVHGNTIRSIITFDADALARLNADSARLEVTISGSAAANWGTHGRTIAVFALTKPWTELGATLNCADDTNTSNNAADCSAATAWSLRVSGTSHSWIEPETATATIVKGQTGVVSFDVTADLARFRSGTPFYGWLLTKDYLTENGNAGDVDFQSRTSANPPRLVASCSGDAGSCESSDGGGSDAGTGGDGGHGGADSGSSSDAGTDSGTSTDSGPTCTPTSCNDSDPCTVDTCVSGVCTHAAAADGVVCSDNDACTSGDRCLSGVCVGGAPVPISDLNDCTLDACDAMLGVTHVPAAANTPCPNGNLCDGDEKCDGAGTCQVGTPLVIDDNNPCTDDSCQPSLGVLHTPRPAGDSACSDHNACNGEEVCSGIGTCQQGAAPIIDDNNVCTVDACSPISGPVHTPIPNCDPTPTNGDAPFETRASIMGRTLVGLSAATGVTFTVSDAPPPGTTATPRTDVVASTAGDGSFRLRLTTFPDVETEHTPPKHVILRVESAGYLTAYRDVWLHTGDAADLGVIQLAARDPAITNIGPAGGTASDSQNRISVVVPAGALTTTVPIQITPIATRAEMPAPLPDSTPTLYGFELEPSGTTFAVPVTVRVSNTKNVPTTLVIPTGFYDANRGLWEHEAQATWDGTRFAFPTLHFSPFDCNTSRGGGPVPLPEPGPPPDPPGGCNGGSLQCYGGGASRDDFSLPTYRVRGEDVGITLSYDSGLAGARTLGAPPTNEGAVAHSSHSVPLRGLQLRATCVPYAANVSGGRSPTNSAPGTCTPTSTCSLGQSTPIPLSIERTILGSTQRATSTGDGTTSRAELSSYVHLPLVNGAVVEPGLYRAHSVMNAQTPGSCVASGGTFGAEDEQAPRVQTNLEPGALASFDEHVFVRHRVSSPYGSGWTVREMSRLFATPNADVAYLSKGDGTDERFRPRAYPKIVRYSTPRAALARDPQTGEVLAARDDGAIDRVDPSSGASTRLVSGLPTSAGVVGFAVAYVGGARRYLIWLPTQLIEADAGGGARVLATRANNVILFQQPNVAARGDLVFFTDGITPVLSRVRLSDPNRTVETMSTPSGGDIRLTPRVPLSGVTFGDPRGLAFLADGTLLLADIRRNTVFALTPQPDGEVGPGSRVAATIGSGAGTSFTPLGERSPGEAASIREPLGLTVAEDGSVFVLTAYGAAHWDPLSREVEWLVFWGGLDEIDFPQQAFPLLPLALTPSSIAFVLPTGLNNFFAMVRLDVDRLSSEFEPTRTVTRNADGTFTLLDTTAERVDRFDRAGRITEHRKRTGELLLGFEYADARSDKVNRITDAAGGAFVFSYDGSGKIASITDARGRVTQLTVDGLGDLTQLQKPDLENYQFTYSEHRITEKRNSRGDLTQYAFRADGTVQSATRPEGAVLAIDAALSHPAVQNANGELLHPGSVTDQHGVVHTFQQNSRGEIERDTYTADGVTYVNQTIYATRINDRQHGHVSDNTMSSRRNRLFRVSHHLLNGVRTSTLQSQYDAHYRPMQNFTTSTDAALGIDGGLNHEFFYDDNKDDGWLVAEGHNVQVVQAFERDAAGHITHAYDANIRDLGGGNGPFAFDVAGKETLYTIRSDGQIATRTDRDASGRTLTQTMQYESGPSANPLGWTDTVGRSMTYTLDARGNIASSSDGTATTFSTFDAMNRLIESRDALGNATTYGYSDETCGCSRDNLVTSIHTPDLPADVDWKMTYDGDGRLSTVTDPEGFTEQYSYEPTGETKTVLDKLGRTTTWTHDQLGRIKSMLDTANRAHANTYANPVSGSWSGPTLMAGGADATLPTTSLTGALRSGDYQIGHNGYPQEGYPAAVSLYRDATFQLGYADNWDRFGRLRTEFDRVGKPIDSVIPNELGTGTFAVRKGWDLRTPLSVLGQELSASTSGNTMTANFGNNAFFENVSTDGYFGFNTGGSSERFTRDNAGRVIQNVRSFTASGSSGPPIARGVTSTYTYRADGRLDRLVNLDGQHDFTYDSRGLMATQTVGGEGTYTYGYDEMGRNSYLEYPDGHVRRQIYDELGRITSRCYEYSLGTVRCYTASYDAVGNPVTMTDPEGRDTIEYDSLDRLGRVTREVGGVTVSVEDYAYNALGALRLNAGVVLDHQRPRLDGGGLADAAVPASLGSMPVALDGGGRITSLQGTTLKWSQGGFLQQMTPPSGGGSIETYVYDASVRRVGREIGDGYAATPAPSNVEFYVYEGLDRIAIFTPTVVDGGSGSPNTIIVKETYLFDGIDHPLRIKRGGTIAYYELDLAGNVCGLRLSGGSDLGGYRYTAFGKTAEDTSTFVQPLMWKARWRQSFGANEVYDVRARMWSPELGAFLSVDGYRYHSPKTTLWSWPRQSPVRFVDWSGHGPEFDIAVTVLVAGFLYSALKPSDVSLPPGQSGGSSGGPGPSIGDGGTSSGGSAGGLPSDGGMSPADGGMSPADGGMSPGGGGGYRAPPGPPTPGTNAAPHCEKLAIAAIDACLAQCPPPSLEICIHRGETVRDICRAANGLPPGPK